jgi:hypothetical protein
MPNDIKKERAAQEQLWLEQMDEIGLETVLARFANRMAVTDLGPYPDNAFVLKWIHNKKDRNSGEDFDPACRRRGRTKLR